MPVVIDLRDDLFDIDATAIRRQLDELGVALQNTTQRLDDVASTALELARSGPDFPTVAIDAASPEVDSRVRQDIETLTQGMHDLAEAMQNARRFIVNFNEAAGEDSVLGQLEVPAFQEDFNTLANTVFQHIRDLRFINQLVQEPGETALDTRLQLRDFGQPTFRERILDDVESPTERIIERGQTARTLHLEFREAFTGILDQIENVEDNQVLQQQRQQIAETNAAIQAELDNLRAARQAIIERAAGTVQEQLREVYAQLNIDVSDGISREEAQRLIDNRSEIGIVREANELPERERVQVANIDQQIERLVDSLNNFEVRLFRPAGEPARGFQEVPDVPVGTGSLSQLEEAQRPLLARLGTELGELYNRSLSESINEGRGVIVRRNNQAGLQRIADQQEALARTLGDFVGQRFREAYDDAIEARGTRIIDERNFEVTAQRLGRARAQDFLDLGADIGRALSSSITGSLDDELTTGIGRALRGAVRDSIDTEGSRIIDARNFRAAAQRSARESVERFLDVGTQIGRLIREQIEDELEQIQEDFSPVVNIGATFITDAVSIPARLLEAEQTAADARLDVEEDLQERLESIRNNSELSIRQRASRIASAEASAAQRRRDIERRLTDERTEAYTGFIRNALRNLAELVAAEVQAAIVRATVAQIGGFLAPTLAAVGTGGSIGLGIAAIAGLQLVASSFHNPENDAFVQTAGFRTARQQLFDDPIGFGEQSGQDLADNYDTGFRRGVEQPSTGATEQVRDRQPIILQLEGRTVAEVLIDLRERGEIPAFT